VNTAFLTLILLNAVAIEHVRVEVGDGRVLEDVTVVIDGDRIVSVSQAPAPAAATKIDGRGKTLTPGFIDASSPLGLKEVDLEPSTVDESLCGAVLAPAFRVAEGFNPL
jgi:imidazolonepropionase-like amidohydrolase